MIMLVQRSSELRRMITVQESFVKSCLKILPGKQASYGLATNSGLCSGAAAGGILKRFGLVGNFPREAVAFAAKVAICC